MANQVVKRDGTKETFDESKIRMSIEMAAKEAGLADDKVASVVSEVMGTVLQFTGGKDEVATSEIATFIIAQLDQVNPPVGEAWRKHEAEKNKA